MTALADAIATQADALAPGLATHELERPDGLPPILAQLPLTVRLQALASAIADARGLDPDLVIEAPWDADSLWSAGSPYAARSQMEP